MELAIKGSYLTLVVGSLSPLGSNTEFSVWLLRPFLTWSLLSFLTSLSVFYSPALPAFLVLTTIQLGPFSPTALSSRVLDGASPFLWLLQGLAQTPPWRKLLLFPPTASVLLPKLPTIYPSNVKFLKWYLPHWNGNFSWVETLFVLSTVPET